jgi:hypothetical protein
VKQHKRALFTVFCVVAFSVVFVVVRIANSDPYALRKKQTFGDLFRLRHNIEMFKESKGQYPLSLSDIQTNAGKIPAIIHPENTKEFISSEEGNGKEYHDLNGHGGWYYNCSSGDVRINLTKPLKSYFRFYFKGDRNEIPSEW